MNISSEEVKAIAAKILDGDKSKKFSSIVDICIFIWEIVDKVIETMNDNSMNMQQKEDFAVSIANSIINFLEERGLITVDLAFRSRNLVRTADVFLDILLSLKSMNNITQMVKNPTKENCIKSIFSILSCFSSKTGTVPSTGTSKVEIIEEIPKINMTPSIIVTPTVIVAPTILSSVEEKVEEKISEEQPAELVNNEEN